MSSGLRKLLLPKRAEGSIFMERGEREQGLPSDISAITPPGQSSRAESRSFCTNEMFTSMLPNMVATNMHGY